MSTKTNTILSIIIILRIQMLYDIKKLLNQFKRFLNNLRLILWWPCILLILYQGINT